MLEIKYLRQNLSTVQEALKARGHQADLNAFQKWDDERRAVLQVIESLRHERNVVSDRIAEIGVGSGFIYNYLKSKGFNIKSIDIDPDKIEKIKFANSIP